MSAPVEFQPVLWKFSHRGMTLEFKSLEYAIAYVRGAKSVGNQGTLLCECPINFNVMKRRKPKQAPVKVLNCVKIEELRLAA